MASSERGDLEKLHSAEIRLLQKVLEISHKYHISYYIIEGSLLGAVRHQGMIPWDDDIDIGMPRNDYERFLEIAPLELDDDEEIITYQTQRKPIRYFSQLETSSVKVQTSAQKKESIRNAWLDIFPLDGMPENPLIRRWHMARILLLRVAIQFSEFDQIVNVQKTGRPFYEKWLIWFRRATGIGKNWDTRRIMRRMDTLLKKYEYEGSTYLVNASSDYKLRAVFLKDFFGTGRLYSFERIKVNGPEKYDPVLTKLYGEYWLLPPENQRNTHFTKVWDDTISSD